MNWWTWALIAWLVLSVPFAVLVGQWLRLSQWIEQSDEMYVDCPCCRTER